MKVTRINRRMISVLVAFALIFTSAPFTIAPTAIAATSTWDGSSTDTEWWMTASNTSLLEIGTAAEFAGFLQLNKSGETFSGKTITLTSDIAFNYSKVSGYTFAGVLDGGNYALKSRNTDSLFTTVTGTIKNLGIEVSGSGLNGAFAETLSGTITNCALRSLGASGDGGMVGKCSGNIINSYVIGNGNIVGHLAYEIQNGSTYANVYSELQSGYLVNVSTHTGRVDKYKEYNNYGSVSNSYAQSISRDHYSVSVSGFSSNCYGYVKSVSNSVSQKNAIYASALSNNYYESTLSSGSNIRKADMTPDFWQNTMGFAPDIWTYTAPSGYPKLKDVPDFGLGGSGGTGGTGGNQPGGGGNIIPPSVIDRSDYYVFPNGGDADLQNTSYIDILNEVVVVPESITMGAYSVDGGRTWKNGSPTDDKNTPPINGYRGGYISKFLNKGGSLVIAEGFNKGTNSPTGKQVKFPHIEARPKMDKLTANYAILHTDDAGNLDFDASSYNYWTITTKSGEIVSGNIMFAETTGGKSSSAQAVISGQWKSLDNGMVIDETMSSKGAKYLVGTAPVASATRIVPKSKAVSITVKPLGKSPKMSYQKKSGAYKFSTPVAVTVLSGSTETVRVINKRETLTLADNESIVAYVALPTAKNPASVVVSLAG